MNTLEFLRRVLPSDGYYCASYIKPNDGFGQKFLSTVEDLSDLVQILSGKNCNVYFGISSYKSDASRKQENIYLTKLFALDIDVGKQLNSYSTGKEALTALAGFVSKFKLPKPTVVSSGKGFHVYWTLTNALPLDKWKPIAERLKAVAVMAGLIIDPVVTADAARILRPIGTTHIASGRTVRLLMAGDDTTPDDFCKAIGFTTQPRRTSLIDNLVTKQTFPTSAAIPIESKCQQIKWAVKNQADVSEPMWYSIMGIAAYTSDPYETAIRWSREHPEYSEQRTREKVDQWKNNATGPATCTKLEDMNPGGCKGCKFFGKINSPTRLGIEYAEAEPAKDAPVLASIIPLPRPFKRTSDGIKMTIDGADVDVCPFDIYPVSYGKDDRLGYETVTYYWNRPHVGWTTLGFRQSLLTDGHRDFPSTCADQGIVLGSKKQTEVFQYMLRSYMDQLRKIKTLTNLYSTMGWKEDRTQFVLGDTVIKEDSGVVVEEQTSLSPGTARVGPSMYGVAGNLKAWSEATQVLSKAKMPWHMFALGMGFAAPLFTFTGLKGMTVSLYGPTGGGKSLAQYWIQSIYGDPDQLHFSAKFTQNALFNRLGMYCNLPLTVDEATMISDKDIGDFLYWVSQGRDKARLSRSSEEREARTWATPVIVSTNISLAAKLISSGLDTNAQIARLLEVPIPHHDLFSRDSSAGQKIYNHVMANYGYAGREFIKELVRLGEAEIRKLIEETRVEFKTKYDASFVGEERYWEQAIILQEVGSKIAHRLGIIQYDYTQGTEWVLKQVGAIRSAASDNTMDAFDVLSEYLNEFSGSAITVMHTDATKTVMADLTRMPRGDIRIRFDMYRDKVVSPFTRGTLLIDRTHFRKWASSKGVDYKGFRAEILSANADATPKSSKALLAKNTPAKLTQSYVVGFNLTHPRLIGVLNDADQDTKLSLVTNQKETMQ